MTARWWFSQPRDNPAVTLEAAILGSYAALSNLVFRGPKAYPNLTTPMRTTIAVWQKARASFRSAGKISPHTPLWGNPNLPHLRTVPDPQVWATKGIMNLRHLVTGGRLMTFQELKGKYGLPNWMFFRFLQVRHAFQHQFPGGINLESDPVEKLLSTKILVAPLSTIYFHITAARPTKLGKLFLKWKEDLPSLEEEEWETCLSSYVSSLISARDRFLQLKFLHRAYYTPRKLAVIYPDRSPACPRCGDLDASFLHMTWSCPRLRGYWEQVLADVNQTVETTIPLCPRALLLNVLVDSGVGKYAKLFIAFATYYARREILLRWKLSEPPTVNAWRKTLNTVLPLYKITYVNRNCPSKFDKIWSSWIDSWGSLPLEVSPPSPGLDP